MPIMKPGSEEKQKTVLVHVDEPHDHDVLCGRGGRTNLHKGNVWFRRLVRSNRALYKTCPKHTKLLVAKAVVKAVQGQDPPGRYLEIDKATERWREIPYKRALDKTSQALRERDAANGNYSAPKARKEAAASAAKGASSGAPSDVTRHRRAGSSAANRSRRSRRSRGAPVPTGGASRSPNPKRQRSHERQEDAMHPLPLDAPPTRQSSFFNFFLSNSGIFGGSSSSSKPPPPPLLLQSSQQSPLLHGTTCNSNSNSSSNNNNNNSTTNNNNNNTNSNNNNNNMIDHLNVNVETSDSNSDFDSQHFALQHQPQQCHTLGDQLVVTRQQPKMQRRNSLMDVFEPISIAPSNGGNDENIARMHQMLVRQQMEGLQRNSLEVPSDNGSGLTQSTRETFSQEAAPGAMASPNRAGLTTQVSDWLTSFFPGAAAGEEALGASVPPPPGQDWQRSISSALFNFPSSPSQLLTSLKTGVTSLFMDQNPVEPPEALAQHRSRSFGRLSESEKDSLLEDTEDTPLEIRMRHFGSRSNAR